MANIPHINRLNKRIELRNNDLLDITEAFANKNPKGIIQAVSENWPEIAKDLDIPQRVISQIQKEFTYFE